MPPSSSPPKPYAHGYSAHKMRLKEDGSVKIDRLNPQMVLAALIVHGVFEDYGIECVITSGNDGKHAGSASRPSLHYAGYALDFRVREVPETERPPLVADLRRALGKHFDVVLHTTHIHVEYDPKVVS